MIFHASWSPSTGRWTNVIRHIWIKASKLHSPPSNGISCLSLLEECPTLWYGTYIVSYSYMNTLAGNTIVNLSQTQLAVDASSVATKFQATQNNGLGFWGRNVSVRKCMCESFKVCLAPIKVIHTLSAGSADFSSQANLRQLDVIMQ